MLATLRNNLRNRARAYLGTGAIPRMENHMASVKAELEQFRTSFADFRSDLDARLDQLLAAQGEFAPDAQVIFDGIKADLASADSKVGDADGSDTVVPPVEPADPETPQV